MTRALMGVTASFSASLVVVATSEGEQLGSAAGATSHVKLLRVEVHQTYGEATDTQVPVLRYAKLALEGAGFVVVGDGAQDSDAIVGVRVEGKPLGASYTFGYLYSGARVEGAVWMSVGGTRVYSRPFSAQKDPPAHMRGRPRHPNQAPFKSVFESLEPLKLFTDMVAEVWGKERSVTALVALLRHSDQDIRESAVVCLSQADERGAVPPLIGRLKDPDEHEHVREQAAVALGNLKASEAVPELIGRFEDRSGPSSPVRRGRGARPDRRCEGGGTSRCCSAGELRVQYWYQPHRQNTQVATCSFRGRHRVREHR